MTFDLTNKTAEELLERQQLLAAEIPAEERDAMPAEEIVRRYHAAGYDGIVITDHYFWMFGDVWFADELCGASHEEYINRWLCGYRKAKAEGDRLGMTVLPGAEVRLDGQPNDYLIYGLDEEFFYRAPRLHRFKTVTELIEALPPDACVVQAHPFREGMTIIHSAPLFGYEGFNGAHDEFTNGLVKQYAAHFNKAITSGSDYHGRNRFAAGGIRTEQCIQTPADLIRVLRSGEYTLIENYGEYPEKQFGSKTYHV